MEQIRIIRIDPGKRGFQLQGVRERALPGPVDRRTRP